MGSSPTASVIDVTDEAVAAMAAPRIAVVGSPSVLLRGLAVLLADEGLDARVVEDADALTETGPYDVVMVDRRMPTADRARIIRAAHGDRADARIAVVALDGREEHILDTPAAVVVDLDTEPRRLAAWLRLRAEGLTAPTRNGATPGIAIDGVAGRLTARELEVLRGVMGGESSTALARRLMISPHTVRTHVQNILAKLNVRSRHEAAALAFRTGLRPVESVTVPASRR